MKIVVGSKNPTKIEPVRGIFMKHFKDVEVIGVEVDSSVSSQPMSDEETFNGAYTRAERSLNLVPDAYYAVGIEGGFQEYPYGWVERAHFVIMNREKEFGLGSCAGILLPNKIIDRLKQGKTLSEVIDELFKTKDIGKDIGMTGIMTDKTLTRASVYKQGVAFALARFLHPEIYKNGIK